MAKKFGKFLLFTAAAGTAAAAAYYYFRKKDAAHDIINFDDDDYDDFNNDLEDDTESSRSYVPLHKESANTTEGSNTSAEETDAFAEEFTPLADHAKKASAEAGMTTNAGAAADLTESVEEFFDEEDENTKEPPDTGK